MIREERKRSRIIRTLLFVLLFAAIAVIGFAVLMKTAFVIRETEVSGCVYCAEEDVLEAVSDDAYSDNSLILWFQLRRGGLSDLPFVDSVEVQFVTPWHIRLQVTEKVLFGVMEDAEGNYIYFDSTGTIVEISSVYLSDAMQLEGSLSGDASEGSSLNLIPSGSLSYVTNVFELTDSYGIDVDMIYLDTSGTISFVTSGITIVLGMDENTEEKFKNLSVILEKLEGMSGTLDLSTFTETGDDIIFSEE